MRISDWSSDVCSSDLSAIARDFFLDEDILRFVPENYRSYHRRRILDLREEPKRLVYDEFHRTQSRIVRQQVLIDIREGRKWGLQIALDRKSTRLNSSH